MKRSRNIYTLAIDTCLEALSVGIGNGEKELVRSRHIGVGHAEHLAPLVADMLEEQGLIPADIGQVCATVGPGSFMGTRVGLSFASGFALPRKLPTLPITTLDALWLSVPEGAKGAVLIDARRDQVYGQTFTPEGGEPFLLDIDDARRATEAAVSAGGVLIGSGTALVWPDCPSMEVTMPDISHLLQSVDRLSSAPLRPLYLRPPDAAPAKGRP